MTRVSIGWGSWSLPLLIFSPENKRRKGRTFSYHSFVKWRRDISNDDGRKWDHSWLALVLTLSTLQPVQPSSGPVNQGIVERMAVGSMLLPCTRWPVSKRTRAVRWRWRYALCAQTYTSERLERGLWGFWRWCATSSCESSVFNSNHADVRYHSRLKILAVSAHYSGWMLYFWCSEDECYLCCS